MPSFSSPSSVLHRTIEHEHGQVDAHSPSALKEAGNDAVRAGDWQRALHMYTLGLDLCVGKGELPQDSAGWYALDAASRGVAHLLLCNRSLTNLNLNEPHLAVQDAECCCLASPGFAKGHLRLLAALEASKAPIEERRTACIRGLAACPTSIELREAKAALSIAEGFGDDGSTAEVGASLASRMAETRRIADDPNDPRRALAAGDLGSALAVGAHGLARDLIEAERYLRIGADGGDTGSQRNLGMLLLQSAHRAAEAAGYLRMAADQGDTDAAMTLHALDTEAQQKQKHALFKLKALASNGDARAKAMLEQLEADRE